MGRLFYTRLFYVEPFYIERKGEVMNKEQVIQRANELAREYFSAIRWDVLEPLAALQRLIGSHPDVFPEGRFDYQHEVALVVHAPRVGIKITGCES